MKVLQVTNIYYPELRFGGPPLKIHLLSKGLREKGLAVNVVTFHSEKPTCSDREELEGIPVQYLPWIGRGFWQWPKRRDLLFEAVQQADIVHFYGLYNALCPLAAWYAKGLRKPYLLEPLGMHPPRARNQMIKKLYHRGFTSWMGRHASAIVASSAGEKLDLQSLAYTGTPLVVRRNGIDIETFRRLPNVETFRTRHGLPSDCRLILYLGRISPIKNLEELIRGFHEANCTGCVLLLAGPMLEPAYTAKLQKLVAALNLQESVKLIGPLYDKDKLTALAAADLFVLPSLSESFGNAAAEAVAAGVPVLLTDTCGIAPIIHRRAGLAVPLGSASIASGLRIMMGPDRLRHVQKQEQVMRELSWDEPVAQTAKLYETLLHAH